MLVREAGLEPARPEWTLEPESSESANSTTRASLERLIIIAPASPFVKGFFENAADFFLYIPTGKCYYNKIVKESQERGNEHEI